MQRTVKWIVVALLFFLTRHCWAGLKMTSKTSRTLKIVRLVGGLMEVVNEDTCSNTDIRLTCRSTSAFIFIITAEYLREVSHNCGYDVNSITTVPGHRIFNYRKESDEVLRGNYIKDEEDDDEKPVVDLRLWFNRRCSGRRHCRFTLADDYPGGSKWFSANVQLKYGCIPDAAVRRFCNMEIMINSNDTGYIKSPGYPLYYTGEDSCGWTFQTVPGQKISLHFYDLNIRSPAPNGTCVDLVRIRDDGRTLFQTCGTIFGTRIISHSNRVTLDLISSSRINSKRGFFIQYEAVGCPEVQAPNGSFVLNDTLHSRTFKCHSGTIFPDTRQSTKTLDCQKGRWNESIHSIPKCVASSVAILKTGTDNNRLSGISDDGVRITRVEYAAAMNTGTDIESTKSTMTNDDNEMRDIVVPLMIIALLFVGNAAIVYVIFQYRKRKVSEPKSTEELALRPAESPKV